jgi:hypothetical protein
MGLIDNYKSNTAYEAVVGSTAKARNIIGAVESTRLDEENWTSILAQRRTRASALVTLKPDANDWSSSEQAIFASYYEALQMYTMTIATRAYIIRVFSMMQKLYKSVLEFGLPKRDARQRFLAYDNEILAILADDIAGFVYLQQLMAQFQRSTKIDRKNALKLSMKELRGRDYRIIKGQKIDENRLMDLAEPGSDDSTIFNLIETYKLSILNAEIPN